MLSGIHFLLTYTCTLECEHCFVYGGPRARGTFTLPQIRAVLDELPKVGSVEQVFFEGGEPALYYPLVLEGTRLARARGFKIGMVTNAYWAISDSDAELWLGPLVESGLSSMGVSDDELHYGEKTGERAGRALAAAERLGLAAHAMSTGRPTVEPGPEDGAPTVGGGVMFRGRAVEKLTPSLPRRPPEEFTKCPHEDLRDPRRVHLDAYGNVHLCQGLCMGNMWRTPLSVLAKNYDAEAHPVCGPLVRGGPAALAVEYGFRHEDGYVDACHLCYLVRRALIETFPQYIAPAQVYGF